MTCQQTPEKVNNFAQRLKYRCWAFTFLQIYFTDKCLACNERCTQATEVRIIKAGAPLVFFCLLIQSVHNVSKMFFNTIIPAVSASGTYEQHYLQCSTNDSMNKCTIIIFRIIIILFRSIIFVIYSLFKYACLQIFTLSLVINNLLLAKPRKNSTKM